MSLGFADEQEQRDAASGMHGLSYENLPFPGTILLVDDEEMIRAFAALALEDAGYRVFQAGDANEAAYVWSRENGAFDLLLADISLPGQSGIEMAENFRAMNSDLHVVFTSGYDEASVAETHGHSQMSFLPKPYSVKSLIDVVRKALPLSAAARF